MRPLLLLLLALPFAHCADEAEKAAAAVLQSELKAMATPDPKWEKKDLQEFPESLRGDWWMILSDGKTVTENKVIGKASVAPLLAPHFLPKSITGYYDGGILKMLTFQQGNFPAVYTEIPTADRVTEIFSFGDNKTRRDYVIK